MLCGFRCVPRSTCPASVFVAESMIQRCGCGVRFFGDPDRAVGRARHGSDEIRREVGYGVRT